MDGDLAADARRAIDGVGGNGVARWEFDRSLARRGAAVCLAVMVIGVAICIVGAMIAPDPLDLQGRPGQTAAGIFIFGVILLMIGAIVGADFGTVARWGGGFVAWPDGLEFRLGRRRMLLPWSAIGRVSLERRSTGRTTSEILAIHLVGAAYRWPRSMLLAGSTPGCLAVTTYVLGGRARLFEDGIARAVDRFRPQPGMSPAEPDGPAQPGARVNAIAAEPIATSGPVALASAPAPRPAVAPEPHSGLSLTPPIRGRRRRSYKQVGMVAFLWTFTAAAILGVTTASIPEGNWINVILGTLMAAGAALLGRVLWTVDPETFDEA